MRGMESEKQKYEKKNEILLYWTFDFGIDAWGTGTSRRYFTRARLAG
jgi:hypothetical protein